jgi:hypothetical protein
MAKDNVVRCKVVETAGIKFWYPEPGDAIFMVDTTVDPPVKSDLRNNPPFYTILPCPWCGVEEDRNHKPLDHVDPRLGKSIDLAPITKTHFKFMSTDGKSTVMVPGETEEAAKKTLLANSPFYTFKSVERIDPPIHNEPWSPYGRPEGGLYIVSEADMEYLRGEPAPLTILVPNIKIEE